MRSTKQQINKEGVVIVEFILGLAALIQRSFHIKKRVFHFCLSPLRLKVFCFFKIFSKIMDVQST